MKDRSKQFSMDTWKDPTRSLTRLKSVEAQLTALFRNYQTALFNELDPVARPNFHTQTVWKPRQPSLDILNRRLAELTQQHLIKPGDIIIERELTGAYVHGTKYATLNLKPLGLKLGAPFAKREEAWGKIGVRVTAAQGEFQGVTDAMNQNIRRVIADSILKEQSFGEVKTAISEAVDGIGVTRAATIARTETMKAINDGVVERYTQAGVEQVEWLAAEDERTCEDCNDLDGQTFNIDEAPECPAHPNCVLPDTLCIAKDVVAGSRFKYSGPIIKITLSNAASISVTPNHLFLTDHGFAAADLLREGDKVVYCPNFKRVIPDDPDDYREPTRIDEVIKSLSETGGSTSTTMPVTSVYFHGDGTFGDGDVDIIRADGFLQDDLKTTFPQHISALQFDAGSKLGVFLSPRSLAQVLFCAAHATDGRMSGTRESSPFFRGRLRHTEKHGLAGISGDDTTISETPDDARSGASENLADLLNRVSGFIEVYDIVGVDVIPDYHGYVYDLQTISTLYCGNGFIISNCRCTLIPYMEAADEATQMRAHVQGSSSSGNYGHEGRPTLVGGSAAGLGPNQFPKPQDDKMLSMMWPDTSRDKRDKRDALIVTEKTEFVKAGATTDTLNNVEKAGIRGYTDGGNFDLNDYERDRARGFAPPNRMYDDEAKELDAIYSKVPTPPPGTEMFRGIGPESGMNLANAKLGDVYTDAGYQSFTLDPYRAIGFSKGFTDPEDENNMAQTIVRAYTGEGTHAIALGEGATSFPYENEILTQRGTKWAVVQKDVMPDSAFMRHKTYIVTVVPA